MSEKYITLRSYHTEQFINSIELQKDKSSKRYGFRHGYDCGFKVAFEQIEALTAKVKRYEKAIKDMASLYEIEIHGEDEKEPILDIARAALNQTSDK